MMQTSGFPCVACESDTLSDEVDRYLAGSTLIALKLRCRACGAVFIAPLNRGG